MRYGVIVADPEWRWEAYSRETGMDRAADNNYPTSVTEVVAERPVAEIAAEAQPGEDGSRQRSAWARGPKAALGPSPRETAFCNVLIPGAEMSAVKLAKYDAACRAIAAAKRVDTPGRRKITNGGRRDRNPYARYPAHGSHASGAEDDDRIEHGFSWCWDQSAG
jgi:hypothetical protein